MTTLVTRFNASDTPILHGTAEEMVAAVEAGFDTIGRRLNIGNAAGYVLDRVTISDRQPGDTKRWYTDGSNTYSNVQTADHKYVRGAIVVTAKGHQLANETAQQAAAHPLKQFVLTVHLPIDFVGEVSVPVGK